MRWPVVLMLAAGCSVSSISTKRVATFGYLKVPSVSLATRGEADYREPVRAGAHRGLPALVDLAEAGEDATLCEAARAQASEQVLIADIEEKPHVNTRCVHEECDPTSGECKCMREAYVSMTTHWVVHLRVLDAASCKQRAESWVESLDVTAQTGEQQRDMDEARRGSAVGLQEQVARGMAEVFARGPQVVRQEPTQIEVAHEARFANGDVFYLRKRQNSEAHQVVVERADASHATFVADHYLPRIEVGDELHKKTIGHRVTVLPTIMGGRLEGNHGIGGVGITARWSASPIPLVVEASLAIEVIPAFNTARYPGGIAAGLRWPLGPVNPIAVAEAGLSHATQDNAESDGGFVGLGVGIELWLGKLCLFGDLRQRWQVAEDWSDADDNPVDVRYKTTDYSMTVIQVGVAWRR